MDRMKKINSQIQKEISHIIQSQVDNPNLGLISVLRVETTRDLGLSKVFVSVLPDSNTEEVIRSLSEMRGFIRRLLGSVLRLKLLPEIKFIPDDSIRRGVNIVNKINELNKDKEEKERET
jgi:ribosome-binding factor A